MKKLLIVLVTVLLSITTVVATRPTKAKQRFYVTGLVLKAQPIIVQATDSLDAVTGIGLTVWTEQEWKDRGFKDPGPCHLDFRYFGKPIQHLDVPLKLSGDISEDWQQPLEVTCPKEATCMGVVTTDTHGKKLRMDRGEGEFRLHCEQTGSPWLNR